MHFLFLIFYLFFCSATLFAQPELVTTLAPPTAVDQLPLPEKKLIQSHPLIPGQNLLIKSSKGYLLVHAQLSEQRSKKFQIMLSELTDKGVVTKVLTKNDLNLFKKDGLNLKFKLDKENIIVQMEYFSGASDFQVDTVVGAATSILNQLPPSDINKKIIPMGNTSFYAHPDKHSKRRVLSAVSEDNSVSIIMSEDSENPLPKQFLNKMMSIVSQKKGLSVVELQKGLLPVLQESFKGQDIPHFAMAWANDDVWQTLVYGDFAVFSVDKNFKFSFEVAGMHLFPLDGFDNRLLTYKVDRGVGVNLLLMSDPLFTHLDHGDEKNTYQKILGPIASLSEKVRKLVTSVSSISEDERVHGYIKPGDFGNLTEKQKNTIINANKDVIVPDEDEFSYYDDRGALFEFKKVDEDKLKVSLFADQKKYLGVARENIALRGFYHNLLGDRTDSNQVNAIIDELLEQQLLTVQYGHRVFRPTSKKIKNIIPFYEYPDLAAMLVAVSASFMPWSSPLQEPMPTEVDRSEASDLQRVLFVSDNPFDQQSYRPQMPAQKRKAPFDLTNNEGISSSPFKVRVPKKQQKPLLSKLAPRTKTEVSIYFNLSEGQWLPVVVPEDYNLKAYLMGLGVKTLYFNEPGSLEISLDAQDNNSLLNVQKIYILSPKSADANWGVAQISA